MAAETKDQALDLVAAVFTRAGARLPRLRSVSEGVASCPPLPSATDEAVAA